MRRWLAAPAVLFAALGIASLSAPPATAQPPAPEMESFLTADGVQLKGIFHATDKAANGNASAAPVVILMYPPGPDRDMNKGDWKGLAAALNDKGYHVFRFDWRGHGKSTDIKDPKTFWENPYMNGNNCNYNAYIKGAGKKPLKNDLHFKDITPTKVERFLPAYLNDLAAVRFHLDGKNDNKSLNSSSVYLVGAGDAATIGLAWMTAEWQRPAKYPSDNQLGNAANYEYVPQALRGQFPPEGGQDIAGAVWLTANRPASVPALTAQKWVSTQAPKIRENNQMLFLYADKDTTGKKMSEFFFNEVLIGNAARAKALSLNPLTQTFIKEVKDGKELRGAQLLGANLKVENTIIDFMNEIQKARAKTIAKERSFRTPYYLDVRAYGFFP